MPGFGSEQDELSPLALTKKRPGAYADTRILLGHLEVPVVELPPGPAPFEHGAAAPGALAEYQEAQSKLLSEVVDSHRFWEVPFATERVADIVASATQQSF